MTTAHATLLVPGPAPALAQTKRMLSLARHLPSFSLRIEPTGGGGGMDFGGQEPVSINRILLLL